MSDTEYIRRDIERTRAELSENVNALADSTNPGNIARGAVDEAKGKATRLKHRIFGDPNDPWDDGVVGDAQWRAEQKKAEAAGAVGEAKDNAATLLADARDNAVNAATDARDTAVGAVQSAPYQVRQRAQGNPLAAGAVALGLGALIGGLLPVTNAEKSGSRRLREQAAPLAEEAKAMAQDAADRLQPVAQEAVETVKGAATAAGQTVADQAAAAKDEVAEHAQFAAADVKETARGQATDVKDHAAGAASEVKSDVKDTAKQAKNQGGSL